MELLELGSIVEVKMSMEVVGINIDKAVTKIQGKVYYGNGDYDYMTCIVPMVHCEVVDRVKEFAK